MSNPTGETQSVQMAFPFVGSLDSLSAGDIVVTVDDSMMSYDVYIGDAADAYGHPGQQDGEVVFEFADIVSTITDQSYRAESFEEDERGRLYSIYVDPAAHQEIDLSVSFSLDETKSKVLIRGFNRYERNGQKTIIGSRCYKPEVLEVLVLGEDIDLDIDAYTDGKPSHSYRVTGQDTGLKPYLMEYVKRDTNAEVSGLISNARLYNLYAKALDNHFTRHMGLCSEDDLITVREQKRIITLVYTVEFPRESEKAESSIAIVKGEDGIYRASMDQLPEEDLSFTLYAFDKITLLDRVVGSVQRRFGYLIKKPLFATCTSGFDDGGLANH